MNQEKENICFGYGDDFYSKDEIVTEIEKRQEKRVKDLSGAAVLWLKTPKGSGFPYDRIGVRILPDGSISFAHAEYI